MKYSKEHEEIVKKFREGQKKAYNVKLLDRNNKIMTAAIKDALSRAFPDITPRTMTRKKLEEEKATVAFSEMPDKLLKFNKPGGKTFEKQVEAWFNEEAKEDFNTIHHAACTTVQEFLKVHYEEESCTYGKAQKVVNMMFKHLYCMDGAEDAEDRFYDCHIALDSFTLEWFRREIVSQKDLNKGEVDNWSTLQYGEGNEKYSRVTKKDENNKEETVRSYYAYPHIVKLIRGYFDKNDHPYKELTPFQAEFYIWQEMQVHLAAEALFGQDVGRDAAMDYADRYYAVKPKGNEFDVKERSFSQYTEMFRGLSLEDKMQFLKVRVEQMMAPQCNTNHEFVPFEVSFEHKDKSEIVNAFSGCVAVYISLDKNKKALEKYINTYSKPDYFLESDRDRSHYLVIFNKNKKAANNLIGYIKQKDYAESVWCIEGESSSCYQRIYKSAEPARRHEVRLDESDDGLILKVGAPVHYLQSRQC